MSSKTLTPQTALKGPYRLVTVNTSPERANTIVGRVIDALKDTITIEHVANCDNIDLVAPTVSEIKPDILFCASMWTPSQSTQIQAIARENVPGIVTYAIPQGLQVEGGADAVVEHLRGVVPGLIG